MAHAVKQKRAKQAKPELAAFVESLAEMADHVASLDSLTDDEKEALRYARDQLNSSVDNLVNIFAAHDAF